MFGNAVTDFAQQAVGTYGYTIKMGNLNAYLISAVQAQPSAASTPDPITAENTIEEIQAYLNDSACPDLAFNFDGGQLTVFFKTSVFAYTSDSRIAVFGIRNSQPPSTDTDLLDIIDDDINLLMGYPLRSAFLSYKNTKSKYVEDLVETEERKITG